MKRREFIAMLGAAAWPMSAHAQASRPVVGFLNSGSPAPSARLVRSFRDGLNELGFAEGRNLAVEFRWAEGQFDRLPKLAADLVSRQVSVIAATGGSSVVLAAKSATPSIPIVFHTGVDPVEFGFVASLNKPGGNLTGVTTLAVELGPKLVELMREAVPMATTVALLVNPSNRRAAMTISKDVARAAQSLGMRFQELHATDDASLVSVFASLKGQANIALIIGPDTFFLGQIAQLASLSRQSAVPTVFPFREFPLAGGLMSYGSSNVDAYRLVGAYCGRVLAGEKPADLPVHQTTKVEMVINLQAAKALGLTFSLPLLGRADEVIE